MTTNAEHIATYRHATAALDGIRRRMTQSYGRNANATDRAVRHHEARRADAIAALPRELSGALIEVETMLTRIAERKAAGAGYAELQQRLTAARRVLRGA